MPPYKERVGQAHSAWRLRHALVYAAPFIQRVQARTLTGQSVSCQVQQHYGYGLHVNWKNNSGQNKKDLCGIERKFHLLNGRFLPRSTDPRWTKHMFINPMDQCLYSRKIKFVLLFTCLSQPDRQIHNTPRYTTTFRRVL